uniref:Uncharacterized protein n=1 Tax=Candidatus Kentrum sp. LFY TaxID=2126342 RepID=A0A450UD60_9GAMM|nr:MAG: hypothetical protein BECKLFY1418A_GA0070994_101130 [Candidatus Kentron sp. LFY]
MAFSRIRFFLPPCPRHEDVAPFHFQWPLLVHYPGNLEKNAQKFVVCHFERSEKSFAFGVSAKSEDLSLRSR